MRICMSLCVCSECGRAIMRHMGVVSFYFACSLGWWWVAVRLRLSLSHHIIWVLLNNYSLTTTGWDFFLFFNQ